MTYTYHVRSAQKKKNRYIGSRKGGLRTEWVVAVLAITLILGVTTWAVVQICGRTQIVSGSTDTNFQRNQINMHAVTYSSSIRIDPLPRS